MRKTLNLLIATALASAFTSCEKCYHCQKKVVVEVNWQQVETDSYFYEDVCGDTDRENMEKDGFTCKIK